MRTNARSCELPACSSGRNSGLQQIMRRNSSRGYPLIAEYRVGAAPTATQAGGSDTAPRTGASLSSVVPGGGIELVRIPGLYGHLIGSRFPLPPVLPPLHCAWARSNRLFSQSTLARARVDGAPSTRTHHGRPGTLQQMDTERNPVPLSAEPLALCQ